MRCSLAGSSVHGISQVRILKWVEDELKNTAIVITCYDRNGNEVKRVTSADDGNVEDPETGGNTQNPGSDEPPVNNPGTDGD